MGYRRLFIIRKDLNLSAGKLAAMVGHCAEAYWTRNLREKRRYYYEDHSECKCEMIVSGDIMDNYIKNSFVKTICQAKNRNNLLKAKMIANELGLVEGTDHSQIWKWLDYADIDMGWEGIIINLDTPYECKRTKNLIKVKRFFDKDLRCTKVNIATTGKYKGIMGSITCNYFDNTVDVGSGFNDSQREYYAKHPEEIVGKIVSVKYKEETQNKDGGKSLQFPVYMGILIDRDKSVDE